MNRESTSKNGDGENRTDERTPLTGRKSNTMKSEDKLYFQQEVRRGTNGHHSNSKSSYKTSMPIKSSAHEPKPIHFFWTLLVLFVALVLCFGFLLSGAASSWLSARNGPISSNRTMNYFDDLGRYALNDYDALPPFSDFLPGLAGIYGKPLYAFYVNRGQAIASFGVESKEYPIMEFQSANKAYQSTALLGFRTFIQGKRRRKSFMVEPFSPLNTRYEGNPQTSALSPPLPKRTLYTGENGLQIQEIDYSSQLETNVTYFILPEEDFGAFVRRTTLTNLHEKESIEISFLDGLARIQPAGGKLNEYLKEKGQTLEAYMGVYFPYEDSINMPFYRLTTEPSTTARVKVQHRGHYCFSLLEGSLSEPEKTHLLPIVYDTSTVFGEDTSLFQPTELFTKSISDIVSGPQYGKAKTSSCFAAVKPMTLEPGESMTISTFFGAADNILDVPVYSRRLMQEGFVTYKLTRTREIIRQITASVSTRTSHQLFDAHVQQMFLDNSLRGGVPLVLGDQDDNDNVLTVDEDPTLKVFHVFSRIHGDLERDYNDFMLSPTFFSEGPGDFRDVIQNRREDVVFNPRIGSFDVRMFLSYIQADGYEPLQVEAVIFTIRDSETCDIIAERAVGNADGHRAQREALSLVLCGGPFRPGQLFGLMEEQYIEIKLSKQDFIDLVVSNAESSPNAVFQAGFWADHWTYYMDIVNSYLSIYPDGEENLMYEVPLPYFFSPASVQPRSKKYVLSLSLDGENYHVRQLDATVDDPEKREYMEAYRSRHTGWYGPEVNWQHDKSGVPFKSVPAAKLFLLATLKFATRDVYGMGIEYEGGRPGWDDGNNGLAGMLGSGMPETYELKILLGYLLELTKKFYRPLVLPIELKELIDTIGISIKELRATGQHKGAPREVPSAFFQYWDRIASAREQYREKTKVTFSGDVFTLSADMIITTLEEYQEELDLGIQRALHLKTGKATNEMVGTISPTYFSFDVVEYEKTADYNLDGHPLVDPKKMEVKQFPLFLEGPTRMMKTVSSKESREIFNLVRQSNLFDKNLSMFTISESLDGQSIDIGRTMAFPTGWMENQSVWLHMSYKFYLELLRSDLHEEFFREITAGGILPFMNSTVYGRSLMECSSYIASSAFEDPSKHGRGFLGRMSGSTAEFLSMWVLMFIGPKPFELDPEDNILRMQLRPSLPAWLFEIRTEDEEDPILQQAQLLHPNTKTLSFKLFSSIQVHYYNTADSDLSGTPPKSYRVGLRDGSIFEINEPSIPADLADKIRRVVFVDFIEAFF